MGIAHANIAAEGLEHALEALSDRVGLATFYQPTSDGAPYSEIPRELGAGKPLKHWPQFSRLGHSEITDIWNKSPHISDTVWIGSQDDDKASRAVPARFD